MLPVITIVGRPNVGKSTLFNVLTRTRDALVADMPGVTRDRQYGEGRLGEQAYLIVDTGGIGESEDPIALLTEQQTKQAIEEADCIFFMMDAKSGLLPADEKIATLLRPYSKKVVMIINKVDHSDANLTSHEFYQLGFQALYSISAKGHRGVFELMEAILKNFIRSTPIPIPTKESGIKIAIVGRPNVGKSTLINRIIGENRVIVLDEPGTTRDSINIPYEREGQHYTLIDTAGIRRRTKITETIEKYSVIKTFQSMESAHVVLLILNAQEGIGEQDLRLLGMAVKLGKALIIAVNKWDGLSEYQKSRIHDEMDRRLEFVNFARRYFISALHGSGVGKLYQAIHEAYQAANQEISTSELTRLLEKAVTEHQPPLVKGRRIKLRYAHLGGHHPMIMVLHGKQINALPLSYKRYLMNYFRDALHLTGVPLIIHFKNDHNPYQSEQPK